MKQSETLAHEYQLRFAKNQAYRNAVWQILCTDFFARFVPANSVVADIGAGWGEFINNIAAREKFAIDLNARTGDHLDPDVRFLNQDCSTPWRLKDSCLDIAFTSNFLEHLPDKCAVDCTICEAYRCLRPDGHLICMGPNARYVNGAYWDFWDHVVPLTDKSLAELLMMRGFEIELLVPGFLPYTMSGRRTPPAGLVRIYLKMPLLWRFFGQQFLVVARKPRRDS